MVYGGKVAAGTTNAVQNGHLIPVRPALVGSVEPAKIRFSHRISSQRMRQRNPRSYTAAKVRYHKGGASYVPHAQ